MSKLNWFQPYVTHCELGNFFLHLSCAALSVKACVCTRNVSLVPQPSAALSVKACACHGVSGSPALCHIECKSLCVLLGFSLVPQPCAALSVKA